MRQHVIACAQDDPAFPDGAGMPGGNSQFGNGLTKREYIAAAVLGELSSVCFGSRPGPGDLREVAVAAVRYADALIAALNEIEIGG